MMQIGRLQKGAIAVTVTSAIALLVVLGARAGEERLNAKVLSAPSVETVELQDGVPEPILRLDVVKDPERGWNAVVSTQDFGLLPDGRTDGVAAGYAYLSVDAGAPERLYSQWVHLPDLADGVHTFTLSLRDTEFRHYQIDGHDIAATYEATLNADAVEMAESGFTKP